MFIGIYPSLAYPRPIPTYQSFVGIIFSFSFSVTVAVVGVGLLLTLFSKSAFYADAQLIKANEIASNKEILFIIILFGV